MPTPDGRARLRLLDGCLTELEEAHEREERTLSGDLAARLVQHVPALAPGMPISRAIDLVLREQELCLGPAAGAQPPPLDQLAASSLSERIRQAGQHVCLLLLEAHERQAPAALGYRGWGEYVREELGLSRRRSYELLVQGRVVRTVREAAGVRGVPHISALAAGEVRPHLDALAAEIGRRAAGQTEAARMLLVRQAVRRCRARAAIERGGTPEGDARVASLIQAVAALAAMPAPDDVSRLVTSEQARRLHAGLREALRRLADLADAWERRDVARLAS